MLGSFMTDVSKECELSIMYTNHSIRATGISVLTRQNFTNSQIMAVSGHKSVQSLAIYQKTAQKEKLEMANVLFQSVTRPEDQIKRLTLKEIQGPQQLKALPPVPASNAVALIPEEKQEENINCDIIVPYEPQFDDQEVSDVDILSALCGIESEGKQAEITKLQTPSTTMTNVMNNFPNAMFSNCSTVNIGTINFNFNK